MCKYSCSLIPNTDTSDCVSICVCWTVGVRCRAQHLRRQQAEGAELGESPEAADEGVGQNAFAPAEEEEEEVEEEILVEALQTRAHPEVPALPSFGKNQ